MIKFKRLLFFVVCLFFFLYNLKAIQGAVCHDFCDMGALMHLYCAEIETHMVYINEE